jgi:hypothetical protein
MTLTQVNSAGIADGAIVNADINNSAAVALSKLATSGTASSSNYLRGDGAWSAIDLSTKLNLTGGTLTGNLSLLDNVIVKFGTGDDLQIKHNGSSNKSIIYHSHASGVLSIAADHLNLADYGNEHPFITCDRDGTVELYYDNSKKLETASWGTQIHGVLATTSHVDIAADNAILKVGASADIQIYHDGTNSRVFNSTGSLITRTTGSFLVQNYAGDEVLIDAIVDGAVSLYYNNVKMLETTTGGAKVNGILEVTSHVKLGDLDTLILGDGSDLQLYHNSGNNYIDSAAAQSLFIRTSQLQILGAGGGETSAKFNDDGDVKLYYDNSQKLATSSTGIWVGGAISGESVDLADNKKILLGSHDDLELYHDGGNSIIADVGTGILALRGSRVQLESASGSEALIDARENSHVSLYYDNSQKFYTQSDKVVSAGHHYPESNYTYNLGHESYQWHTVFAKNTAKAYGNFNQTNHGARRNWNIQSYTDYGTGQTRVTFTTALAADYIVCASGSRDLPESSRCYPTNIDNINTGYFELTNHNDGSTNVDWALMMFTVFGSS